MYDFSSKVALVTGGVGNLGQSVAFKFKTAQAIVVVVDHKTGRLSKVYPEWQNDPNTLLIEKVDVTNPDDTKTLVNQVVERFGQIDVLVNTVGGYKAGTPIHQTSSEIWDLMFAMNARSVFNMAQQVLPVMLQQRQGKIINIAAVSALKGGANSSAYAASKSAVARLTESMAAEVGKQGLHVNAILPTIIDTPQNRQAMPNADHSQWTTPEAIADVILFLASDYARAINGALIPV